MGHWLTVQMLDLKSLTAEGHDTEQVISPLTASFLHLQKKVITTLSISEGYSNHLTEIQWSIAEYQPGSLCIYILSSPKQDSYAIHFRKTVWDQTLVQLFYFIFFIFWLCGSWQATYLFNCTKNFDSPVLQWQWFCSPMPEPLQSLLVTLATQPWRFSAVGLTVID